MTDLALPAPFETPRILVRLPRWTRPWEKTLDDEVVAAITVPHAAANKRTTTGTTLVVTITAPTSGNTLVVAAGGFRNLTSISGGGVTTWAVIPSPNQGFAGDASHNDADLWWGTVDTTPTTSVTLNFASTTVMFGFVLEVAGAQKVTDTSVVFANDAQGSSDSKTITTGTNGCLIISALSATNDAALTDTVPTGYTQATGANQSTGSHVFDVAYLIQSTAGASTMNWTGLSAATFPAVGAVALKASGAAAGSLVYDDRRVWRNSLLRRHHQPRDRVSVYIGALRPGWRPGRSGILVPEYA